ncbi:hypothetical protein CMI37_36235 [Candidatus Pacearchaeota archaeon]|nr:hypothetical protein [Candidatus Pacearchaeota archaeon]|tara:strand:- start:5059 stop:5715 length:657 start_codon:yes stop_codon:yes gene_type:complete
MAFEQGGGQPSPEDFGTPNEIEEFLRMAEQQTGLSRDQFARYGQQGIDYQTKRAARDPKGAGTVAGRGEIQRFMAGSREQLSRLAQQNAAGGDPAFQTARPTDSAIGPLQPPVSQYAEAQGFQAQTPSAQALQRLYSGRITQLELELGQERKNSVENAAKEAYESGLAEGRSKVLEAGAERGEGSPAARNRLAEAQRRRALASKSLEQRLGKLGRGRA